MRACADWYEAKWDREVWTGTTRCGACRITSTRQPRRSSILPLPSSTVHSTRSGHTYRAACSPDVAAGGAADPRCPTSSASSTQPGDAWTHLRARGRTTSGSPCEPFEVGTALTATASSSRARSAPPPYQRFRGPRRGCVRLTPRARGGPPRPRATRGRPGQP